MRTECKPRMGALPLSFRMRICRSGRNSDSSSVRCITPSTMVCSGKEATRPLGVGQQQDRALHHFGQRLDFMQEPFEVAIAGRRFLRRNETVDDQQRRFVFLDRLSDQLDQMRSVRRTGGCCSRQCSRHGPGSRARRRTPSAPSAQTCGNGIRPAASRRRRARPLRRGGSRLDWRGWSCPRRAAPAQCRRQPRAAHLRECDPAPECRSADAETGERSWATYVPSERLFTTGRSWRRGNLTVKHAPSPR